MDRHPKYLLLSSVIAVVASVIPLPSGAAGGALVINEVYSRGGSANQPYRTKFVELYNPGSAPVSLGGFGLSYSAAANTDPGSSCALNGSVPARGYFLIGVGSNGSVGASLDVDQSCSAINPSGTAGAYTLMRGTDQIDLVGWGSAKRFEGAPAVYPGTSSTAGSISRHGAKDSDNNQADFVFNAVPSPERGGETPPPPLGEVSIAEIQGTGSSTQLAGREVTTVGVITAAYPTGGFDGLYLQTPGTGGRLKKPGQASDGIFVFSGELAKTLRVGQCVTVTGQVSEFNGLTQLVGRAATPMSSCAEVKPTVLPSLPVSDEEKEVYEGMLVKPGGRYTVTNNYALNSRGQVGLAFGASALRQATDVVAPGPEAVAYEKGNLAKLITLDDGSSWDYLRNQSAQNTPLPYLSQNRPMRVGSAVTFTKPVILDFRFQWNFQPTAQIIGSRSPAIPVKVANTREKLPKLKGNASIASFNVLNYFTDLGKDEPGCQPNRDRLGNPVTANRCQVRGAWSEAAFKDQETKIVSAINELDTDVVALMEVENPAGVTWSNKDRDGALKHLVKALNDAAGNERWAFVGASDVTPPKEDAIRTAFIYNPETVSPVGTSHALIHEAFSNARPPLAQEFQVEGAASTFVMVVNHYKSKGSGEDDGTGQGLSNPSREAQSRALVAWVSEKFYNKAVFLVGDFNSYARETPLQILESAGYVNTVKRFEPDSATYQYGGRIGSLDHIFANARAMALVSGAAVWDINGDESTALEYSQRNFNVTDFYEATPYRASDHDPVLAAMRLKRVS